MENLKTYQTNANALTIDLTEQLKNIYFKPNVSNNINNFIVENHNEYHFNNLDKNDIIQLNNCIKLYTSNNCIEHYFHFFENYIKNEFSSLENKIGLDFGCWFGISSLIYSLFNNKIIYATDFYKKNLVDRLFCQLNNTSVEYYHIKDFNTIKTVDWIIIYDVLDSYISEGDKIEDFSKRLEELRNLLNDDGILVITDFESTSKIKLLNLEKIICKYFLNYKIYYDNNDSRFVITCYRNISNSCLINLLSFSYTGTSFISRILSSFIDGNNLATYLENFKRGEDPICYNCNGICKFKNIEYIKNNNSHCVLNNTQITTEYEKYFSKSIKIYISRCIYAMIYIFMKRNDKNITESLNFWLKALLNNITKCDHVINYENFTENYEKEIIKCCDKFNIKYNFNFNSKRCNIFNHANQTEMFHAIYKNQISLNMQVYDLTSSNCQEKDIKIDMLRVKHYKGYDKYKTLFELENKGIITTVDTFKNKFSLNDFNLIYSRIKRTKVIDPMYYKYNIVVNPEKCFETYFLFRSIECCFKKTNIYNKELDNYSILIEESDKLSNHYIERTFYNIKDNVDFDIEFLIKTNFQEYQLNAFYTDKSGNYKSNILDLNKFNIYKDSFKKIKLTFNSNVGNNVCNLKLILLYKKLQNYMGNKKRKIEFVL